MSQVESKEVDLEEILLTNSFYSYDKPAGHTQLKSNQVPTSFMKNSPSIKALESILNEKSRSFNYSLNNLSNQSVQTFQTAPEHNSSKLETIDASPSSFNDSTVNEPDDNDGFVKHLDPSTATFGYPMDEERLTNATDNDDTLIDEVAGTSAAPLHPQPKYIKMPSLIPPDLRDESTWKRQSMVDIPEKRQSMVDVAEDSTWKRQSMIDTPQDSTWKRQSMIDIPEETPSAMATPKQPPAPEPNKTPKSTSFGTFEDFQTPKRHSISMTPSPRKSPHLRSNSAFNLAPNKPESPKKHKRSSTLSDLSNLKGPATDDKKSKFSFRSLFRKKDKKSEEIKKAKETKKVEEPKVKRDSKETTGKKAVEKTPKSQPVVKVSKPAPASVPYSSNIKLPSERKEPSKSFKSNTNMNFIREVADDYQEPLQEFNDDYDNHNITHNPPTKMVVSNKYGEEMTLEPSPLPRSNNPFVNFTPSQRQSTFMDEEEDDIFGSPKRGTNTVNESLLGDSLFPKSLSTQEVESIVSLERSRSMRSVKSSKRTSFVNVDGSDENIILFNDSMNNSFNSPVSNTSRSNSILKKSKYGSIDSKITGKHASNVSTGDDSDFNDLMEFSDFINFDNFQDVNLEFSVDVDHQEIDQTPNQSQSPEETPAVKEIKSQSTQSVLQPPVPSSKPTDSKRFSYHPGTNDSPIVISSSSSIEEDSEEPIRPLNVSPRTPEITVSQQQIPSLLTPSLKEIDINQKSPEQVPVLNEKNTNVRPISMSFKGLKGPSFGNKLSTKALRESESHQSFNMTFNDDDSDLSGSAVGGGFGSSDEEEEEELDLDEYNYNQYYNDQYDSEEEELENQQEEKENFSHFQPPPPLTQKSKRNNIGSPESFASSNLGRSSNFTASPRSVVPKKKSNGVRFSSRIILYDTYNGDEYDRHPDLATCNQLTPMLAQMIREEVNEIKANMPVHELSRCNTHFF